MHDQSTFPSPVLLSADAPHATRRVSLAFVVIALALLARVGLSAISLGTNDAMTFAEFGKSVHLLGLVGAYRNDVFLNHPPLVALWAAAALRVVGPPPVPLLIAFPLKVTAAFAFVFRLPIIAADALACGLLYARWRNRLGRRRAAALAAAFAWAPASFLVSAFHANTDPLYSALCLLAVFLMEERRSFFWGGLALGAAINVKIIPGLMVAPLLLSCRSRAEARLFVGGLALAAIPFLPLMLADFPTFLRNVLSYAGFPDAWGVNFFLMNAQRIDSLARPAGQLVGMYHSLGRMVLLSLVVGWAILVRVRPRWDRYEVAAVTAAIFMAFSPSFGVQYLVLPGLMLFAVRPRLAIAYAIASGAFFLKVYGQAVPIWHAPLVSMLTVRLRLFDSILLFPSWAILIAFLWNTVVRRAIGGAERDNATSNTSLQPSAAIGAARPDARQQFADPESRDPIAA